MADVLFADLPSGWSVPKQFSEDVHASSLVIELAGWMSQREGGPAVSGSAAALVGTRVDPTCAQRAAYELCERIAVAEHLVGQAETFYAKTHTGNQLGVVSRDQVFPKAPPDASWSYSRSNGVALHSSWGRACERAFAESVERDAVLHSWYGGDAPTPRTPRQNPVTRAMADHYELLAVEFACQGPETVCGLFGFPITPESPLIMGFGADTNRAVAWERCETEALQRLGFLWGESIPDTQPSVGKSAVSQQEYYLWPGSHEALRKWLGGAHAVRRERKRRVSIHDATFADLTPPEFRGSLAVAKLVCSDTLPLVFGLGHPTVEEPLPSMRVQPIG